MAAFRAFYDFLESTYDGDFYVEEISNDGRAEIEKEYETKEEEKPLIHKKDIWSALRGELYKKELRHIRKDEYRWEPDRYYDFDLIMKGVYGFMNGGVSADYFKEWLITVGHCYNNPMK